MAEAPEIPALKARDARPLRARQRFGKYKIRRRLGEGGFATVYEAYDTIEGVTVAIKVPHPHLVTPKMLAEFRAEVRLTSRLDHPNVLTVKTAQFIDGHFAIVYPRGDSTLHERMQKRLSFETKAEFAEQMLDAVAHAHERNVIHCDLKPENLLLFEGPSLRLTDFGISRLAAHTMVGSGTGTVGYVAPEQALGRTSFRSDVFSLGLILYELFVGELPEWPYAWPPPGIERLRKAAHPAFIALIRRAIEVDLRRRFPDAIAMHDAFLRLSAGRRLAAPAARRRRRGKRRRVRDWRTLRKKQFLRQHRHTLHLVDACPRCDGPMSESMLACPFCGASRKRYHGKTRRLQRCTRCKRGRNPDWAYCPWCWGPGFRTVAERHYKDATATARCRNRRCERRAIAPFMRYCPWCHTKVHRGWALPGSKAACGSCGWGVPAGGTWSYCAWCGDSLPPPEGNGR